MATLTYADVQGYIAGYLTSLGTYNPLPFFDPGPDADLVLQDQSPNYMVMIVVGGGAGLDVEEVFDRALVHIRTIGNQEDYTGAEKLAQDVDRGMNAIASSQSINNKWTLSIVRSGGAPSLLLRDDGDRYHFTCNYIWEVQY